MVEGILTQVGVADYGRRVGFESWEQFRGEGGRTADRSGKLMSGCGSVLKKVG